MFRVLYPSKSFKILEDVLNKHVQKLLCALSCTILLRQLGPMPMVCCTTIWNF